MAAPKPAVPACASFRLPARLQALVLWMLSRLIDPGLPSELSATVISVQVLAAAVTITGALSPPLSAVWV